MFNTEKEFTEILLRLQADIQLLEGRANKLQSEAYASPDEMWIQRANDRRDRVLKAKEILLGFPL